MLIDNPLLKEIENYPDLIPIFQKVKGSNVLYDLYSIDFMNIKFKDIEYIKSNIISPDYKSIKKVLKIVFEFRDFENLRAYEFYQAWNYITEQIKIIIESEKNLHTEPSQRLVSAGIERMSIFGALNVLDDIGQRYGVPPHKVEKWTYGLVFSLSLKMKYEADIQRYLEKNEY
jgi:hypothetical protein